MGRPVCSVRQDVCRDTARAQILNISPGPVIRAKKPVGFPARVQLGLGSWWRVEYATNLAATRNTLGECHAYSRLIILDANQDRESLRNSLMHEMLHALLSDSSEAVRLDCEDEEHLVRELTPRLLAALRGNSRWW